MLLLVGCEARFPDEPPADMESALTIRDAVEEGAGGAQAVAAALPDPMGWGTLKGIFKVSGQPPAPDPLAAAATHQDARICAPGGQPPRSEEIVVGPNGGLSGVVVYLSTPIPTDDPKWLHESYEAQRNAEVMFDQENCIFTTHVAAIWTSQTLKILNSDPIGHNTKIDPKGGARPFNQTIGANGSTTYQPGGEERSPAPVSCSIHPWMKAWLLPRDNPYFAVTNENGEFEIPNLPAGVELEFRVWQPHLDYVDGVTPEGSDESISRGRVKLTLNPDEARDFNVTLDAAMF
ncbi:MAG: hypothetical protein KY475_04405 [Planctomycetes bacterium]|nr:hypothetical protein [Planctomycetota bacterium]